MHNTFKINSLCNRIGGPGRKFLTDATVASTLAAQALGASAHPLNAKQAPKSIQKPFVVKAGETRFGKRTPFRVVNANDLKVSSKDTSGAVCVFEYDR